MSLHMDLAELAMLGDKWRGCWFQIEDNADYFAGEIGKVLYRAYRAAHAAVEVTLMGRDKSYHTVMWIRENKGTVRSFSTFHVLDEISSKLWAKTDQENVSYDHKGVHLLRSTGTKTLTPKYDLKINFGLPRPGLVTIHTGPFKGQTVWFGRRTMDIQSRGAVPGNNIILNPIDSEMINAENLPHPSYYNNQAELKGLYASVYDSLINSPYIGLHEAINILLKGEYLSHQLNDRFAIQLSLRSPNFSLYYGTVNVGEVDMNGQITLEDDYKWLRAELDKVA